MGQGIQRKPFPGVLLVRLHHPGLSRVSPGDYLEGYKMFMGLDIIGRAEDLKVPNRKAGFLPDLPGRPFKDRFVVFLLAPRQAPAARLVNAAGVGPVYNAMPQKDLVFF